MSTRGFPKSEFEDRVARAQTKMVASGLQALLLTTEPEIRYFTGFLTRFWESPTRPWFVVLPSDRMPIAVIPSIGAHLMAQTWITDIRTWVAPDYSDDGIGLLSDTLREVTEEDGWIGLAGHTESRVGMPLADFERLRTALGTRALVSDQAITQGLRLIKSPREIDKIQHAIQVAERAFDRVPEIASVGVPLSQVFRDFQRLGLEEGADWLPYLAGAAGINGYGDVISPASDAPLSRGDVLMLDTGLVWDGYFCDFDRNFALGEPSDVVRSAHARLLGAVHAAFEAAKPGVLISDLFHAMTAVVGDKGAVGRLGHGLGMQLTEWPSIIANDHTPLAPGMVLTLEPAIETEPGKLLVHEENIVIREEGPAFLTTPAPAQILVL
ncbi:MAG: Xaa-Pro peptidase family protein [Pseudomonadota bacterium]